MSKSRPNATVRRRPSTWEARTGIKVLDPDGWRMTNTPWTKAVDFDEWTRLWQASTVRVVRKDQKT